MLTFIRASLSLFLPNPLMNLASRPDPAGSLRDQARHVYDLRFGDHDDAAADLPPQLLAYGLRLYAEARKAYDVAGCPLGPTDEAMLVWFTFDPQTSGSQQLVSEN